MPHGFAKLNDASTQNTILVFRTFILGCRCNNCSDRNIDCVTLLLEAGSDIDARDGAGRTPLECATDFMMADCASLLLEYGAKANYPVV